MTPQEMFDKAYLGVIQQGQKSEKITAHSPTCAYRGPNGTKCGIGHLIPDNLAKAWDRRTCSSISSIQTTATYPIPEFIEQNKQLALAIQNAHDRSRTFGFIDDFKSRMALVAKNYKLTIPQLENN